MAKLESDSEALVLSARVQDALVHYSGGDEAGMTAARRELMRALLERYGSFDFINQKYLLDRDNRIIDAQVFSTLGRGVVQFVERAPKRLGRPPAPETPRAVRRTGWPGRRARPGTSPAPHEPPRHGDRSRCGRRSSRTAGPA